MLVELLGRRPSTVEELWQLWLDRRAKEKASPACHVTATSLPRHCHFTATSLPRHCHVTATSLPRHCHVKARVEDLLAVSTHYSSLSSLLPGFDRNLSLEASL